MPADLALRRRYYAEEIQAISNLQTAALVDALAAVPREAFLPPGPWMIRAEGDFGAPPRHTPDGDARHLYHNLSVAIDPARMLFNGAPSVVGMCIDRLGVTSGHAVLHVGTGAGYYTAVMAEVVGGGGRVVGIEADGVLARSAQENLAPWAQVEIREGHGIEGLEPDSFDAILVNAGTTHPHEAWLAALKPGGRLVVPLTFTAPQMGPIGKGAIALLTRAEADGGWPARVIGMVAIYSAVGIRDEALNDRIRDACVRGPWPTFTRLRRDAHEPAATCWLHGGGFCLSSV